MRFNIVCRPNTDVKTIKTKSNVESETTKMQLEYWTKFRDKLMATKKFTSLHTPRPQYWFDVALGKSGINLSNTCNAQKSIVGVRVYISSKVADTFIPALEARKSEINKALGCEPEWFPNPNAIDKTITLQYQTDLSDPQKVEESLDWMVKHTIVFREVFSKEIKAIK